MSNFSTDGKLVVNASNASKEAEPAEVEVLCGGVRMTEGDKLSRDLYCSMYYVNWYYRGYFLPICICSGIPGNIMTIKILFKSKEWVTTWRIYYLTMALADLAYTLSFTVPEWTGEGFKQFSDGKFQIVPENLSLFSCRTFRFVWNVSWFISKWALTVYSLEKLYILTSPSLPNAFILVRNAKKISILIVGIGFSLFCPIFFSKIYILDESKPYNERYCYLNTHEINLALIGWLATTLFGLTIIIPPVLLIIINVIICCKLIYYSKDSVRSDTMLIRPEAFANPSEIKYAKDLLILSVITWILSFPTSIWAVIYGAEGRLIHI